MFWSVWEKPDIPKETQSNLSSGGSLVVKTLDLWVEGYELKSLVYQAATSEPFITQLYKMRKK